MSGLLYIKLDLMKADGYWQGDTIKTVTAIITLLIGTLATQTVDAEESTNKFTPIQISVWNPVQLAPADWDVWGLRLNLPYGKNKEVFGVDLGLVNSASTFEGVQMGFWNDVGGVSIYPFIPVPIYSDAKGIQIGSYNSCLLADFTGIQIAGNFNNARSFTGLQAAGLWNDNMGGCRGVQIALLFNANAVPVAAPLGSSQSFTGIQIAGLWNRNGQVKSQGVQLAALVNRSENMKGVQIGLINYAGNMTGLQIGMINIIKDNPLPFFPVINVGF